MNDEPFTEGWWARLPPLLPLRRPSRGRPARDHRTVVKAILWILRTGAPWRDPPADARVCWQTTARHLYRWAADQDGVIDRSLGTSSMAVRYALVSTLQVLEVAAKKTRHSVEAAGASPARFTSRPKGTASS